MDSRTARAKSSGASAVEPTEVESGVAQEARQRLDAPLAEAIHARDPPTTPAADGGDYVSTPTYLDEPLRDELYLAACV